jgi:hypothetical protein
MNLVPECIRRKIGKIVVYEHPKSVPNHRSAIASMCARLSLVRNNALKTTVSFYFNVYLTDCQLPLRRLRDHFVGRRGPWQPSVGNNQVFTMRAIASALQPCAAGKPMRDDHAAIDGEGCVSLRFYTNTTGSDWNRSLWIAV